MMDGSSHSDPLFSHLYLRDIENNNSLLSHNVLVRITWVIVTLMLVTESSLWMWGKWWPLSLTDVWDLKVILLEVISVAFTALGRQDVGKTVALWMETIGQHSSRNFDIEPPSSTCPDNKWVSSFLWICEFWLVTVGVEPCSLLGDFLSAVPLLEWSTMMRIEKQYTSPARFFLSLFFCLKYYLWILSPPLTSPC